MKIGMDTKRRARGGLAKQKRTMQEEQQAGVWQGKEAKQKCVGIKRG